MKLNKKELKEFLDEKADQYNTIAFIESDPVSIPHLYTLKEDIEISGFLSATIAWGNRKAILKSAARIMDYLGNSPYDFIMNHDEHDLERISGSVHRTFNSDDLIYFIKALRNIYMIHGGLEGIFNKYRSEDSLQPAITALNHTFFELTHEKRTVKHISDPSKGSAAKKINMFLRIIRVAINQNILIHPVSPL